MAFGNPYDEAWNPEIAMKWTAKLCSMGVKIVALSDTIGASTPENISQLFSHLIPEFNGVEFGAHLHSRKETSKEKIKAAYEAGCKRFDSAIRGFGGCPMAKDDLTGNIATEDLIEFFNSIKETHNVNEERFEFSMKDALNVFPH